MPTLSNISKQLMAATIMANTFVTVSATFPTNTTVCHVTSYTAVPAAVAACTSIVLNNVKVPGNATLDLSELSAGTIVTFAGITTFDYANANYNLITVGGTNITITAEPDAIIDGNGQAWWDGQGSNGGITK